MATISSARSAAITVTVTGGAALLIMAAPHPTSTNAPTGTAVNHRGDSRLSIVRNTLERHQATVLAITREGAQSSLNRHTGPRCRSGIGDRTPNLIIVNMSTQWSTAGGAP